MPATNNILRFKTLLILVVFGVSLLPRQVVHNFVTSHKHIKYASHPGKAQLSAETFSCSADTLFLQQNFDAPVSFSTPVNSSFTERNQCNILLRYYGIDNSFTSLRGPPVMA